MNGDPRTAEAVVVRDAVAPEVPVVFAPFHTEIDGDELLVRVATNPLAVDRFTALVAVPYEAWKLKRRSGLPSFTYWVLTAHALHVLVLEQGSILRLAGRVGCWRRDEVEVLAADLAAVTMTVRLPGRPANVDVTASRPDDESRQLVQFLETEYRARVRAGRRRRPDPRSPA